MMRSCKEVSLLVSKSQEMKLSLREKAALRIHLTFCQSCRHFSRNTERLRSMMKKFAARHEPPRNDDSEGT